MLTILVVLAGVLSVLLTIFVKHHFVIYSLISRGSGFKKEHIMYLPSKYLDNIWLVLLLIFSFVPILNFIVLIMLVVLVIRFTSRYNNSVIKSYKNDLFEYASYGKEYYIKYTWVSSMICTLNSATNKYLLNELTSKAHE